MNTIPEIKPIPHPRSWGEALDVVPPILMANAIKPLALGTREALYLIRSEGVSKKAIVRMLQAHTNTLEYHEAVIAETHRYALSGIADQPIKESHKEFSRKRLEAGPA